MTEMFLSIIISFVTMHLDSIEKKHLEKEEINFLPKDNSKITYPVYKTLERPTEKKTGRRILLTVIFIFLICSALYASEKIFSVPDNRLGLLSKLNPVKQIISLLTTGSFAGFSSKINILVMGIGGAGHDGPYLTDSMMVISFDPGSDRVAMISIPRDMVVKNKDGVWVRINQIYSEGRSISPEAGASDIQSTVEKTLDIKLDYYGIIDFAGFKNFVDKIGGVEVNVENDFIDRSYPTLDSKTQIVIFKKGLQTMSGERALEFARSRHGTNNESSDFARSRRQQLIIQAVKNKLLSSDSLTNTSNIKAVYEMLTDHIQTNVGVGEILKFIKLLPKIEENNISRLVIDDGVDGVLEAAITPEGAFVLQPKDGTYNTLRRLVKKVLDSGQFATADCQVQILNGTGVSGMANQTGSNLSQLGFKISSIGNAKIRNYSQTQIFINPEQKIDKDCLSAIKDEFGQEDILDLPPINSLAAKNDLAPAPVVIILGQDYATKLYSQDIATKPFSWTKPSTTPQVSTSSPDYLDFLKFFQFSSSTTDLLGNLENSN